MADIKSLLPHREPFLFVDEILESNKEQIIATRTYTSAEPFFKGHFPEYPVVPGVILVETMAQCGGAGVRMSGVLEDRKLFFLATIDKVKFRRQVRPDELVRFEIKNNRISARMLKQSGVAYVGDEVAAEAEWMCLGGDAPV
jgi:3-hydroxyacyl-[acyl-carrier-protein] dehydratase